MGRFRSLFDADEMRELAVAAGLVESEETKPVAVEPPRRRSLLLDDDAPESSEASLGLVPQPAPAQQTASTLAESSVGQEPGATASPDSSGVRVFPAGDTYTVARPRLTSVSGEYPRVQASGAADDSSLRAATAAEHASSTGHAAPAEPEPAAQVAETREVSSPGTPAELEDGSDDREARVRRLLIQYLSGEQPVVHTQDAVSPDASSTPLPAIVLDSDDASMTPHAQGFAEDGVDVSTDVGARPFLPAPGSAPSGTIQAARPETRHHEAEQEVEADDKSAASSGAESLAAVVAGFDGSFTPAPPGPADTGMPAFDTPFRASGPNTAVSAAMAPAPLPGQGMLTRLGRPPLFTLLRASLLARVPWRAWQEQPWSQPHLCDALATVTGESEQFFSQEGAWRS